MTRLEALICAVVLGLLAVLVLVLPAAQQEPLPHDQQPSHCSNAKEAKAPHRCECKKAPGEDGEGCEREDVKCKVYCKPNHCHCFHPQCDS